MLAGIQTRKCLRCGHTFTHILGGFVYIMFPKCPKCGSYLTIPKWQVYIQPDCNRQPSEALQPIPRCKISASKNTA